MREVSFHGLPIKICLAIDFLLCPLMTTTFTLILTNWYDHTDNFFVEELKIFLRILMYNNTVRILRTGEIERNEKRSKYPSIFYMLYHKFFLNYTEKSVVSIRQLCILHKHNRYYYLVCVF